MKPTIPQTPSGLQGLTSCCNGAATFCEAAPGKPEVLCCKKCYKEVQPVVVTGKEGQQLDRVIRAWVNDSLTWEDVLVFQNALLTGKEQPVPPMGYIISMADLEAAAK